ncbi:hypothetical protein IEQ34_016103 [Dendrobium chrysotoxum]|uniref:Uncharacterized protein n=1 Tax=Dendrobium chrysotoxum TaxID=161865 RepID=A0AAV7GE55_DENCH|nr:hypothetical protein IEQ34_016103 [Dendrobium chrysotoxum]
MRAGHELKTHRRNQRWENKSYEKTHLRNEWKRPIARTSHAKAIVLEDWCSYLQSLNTILNDIGELTGSGHDYNLMASFGDKLLDSKSPDHNYLHAMPFGGKITVLNLHRHLKVFNGVEYLELTPLIEMYIPQGHHRDGGGMDDRPDQDPMVSSSRAIVIPDGGGMDDRPDQDPMVSSSRAIVIPVYLCVYKLKCTCAGVFLEYLYTPSVRFHVVDPVAWVLSIAATCRQVFFFLSLNGSKYSLKFTRNFGSLPASPPFRGKKQRESGPSHHAQ